MVGLEVKQGQDLYKSKCSAVLGSREKIWSEIGTWGGL